MADVCLMCCECTSSMSNIDPFFCFNIEGCCQEEMNMDGCWHQDKSKINTTHAFTAAPLSVSMTRDTTLKF